MDESLIEKQNGNFANTVLPAVPSSEVYLEDCVTALKRYADNHFDLAIVDPPYGINMAMGHKGSEKRGDKNKYKSFAGNDNTIPNEEYFAELVRVSKNQIVWGANYMIKHLEFLALKKAPINKALLVIGFYLSIGGKFNLSYKPFYPLL